MSNYLQKMADLVNRLEAAQKEQDQAIKDIVDLLHDLASTLPLGSEDVEA